MTSWKPKPRLDAQGAIAVSDRTIQVLTESAGYIASYYRSANAVISSRSAADVASNGVSE